MKREKVKNVSVAQY